MRRALLLGLLGGALVQAVLPAACTREQGERVAVDLAACSLGRVPDAVRLLVPDLVAAANGSAADWAGAEAGLSGLAADDAVCVLMAALHEAQKPGAAARSPLCVDRLRVALAERGVSSPHGDGGAPPTRTKEVSP